jgi:uncharacterized protein
MLQKELVMKIVLFGASGMIGQRVLAEAVSRGHTVTAVVRDPSKVAVQSAHVTVKRGDLTDAAAVPTLIAGHDVVVSAYAAPKGNESILSEVAGNLVSAVRATKPSPRLIVVGGAGLLKTAPDLRLIDTPNFPAFIKPIAQAAIDSFTNVYSKAEVNWTYFAPAALIQPGERTGQFRTSADQLVTDEKGNSHISAEDFAVALVDEIEKPKYLRSIMTAGY